jgi:hypothetical protein
MMLGGVSSGEVGSDTTRNQQDSDMKRQWQLQVRKVTQSVFSHSSRKGSPSPIHLESVKMALVGAFRRSHVDIPYVYWNAGNGGLTHPST